MKGLVTCGNLRERDCERNYPSRMRRVMLLQLGIAEILFQNQR